MRNQGQLNFFFTSVSCLFTKHVCGPSCVAVQDAEMFGPSTRSSFRAGHSRLSDFFSRPAVCWLKVKNVNKKIIRHFHTPSIFTIMNCGGTENFFGNRKLQKTWLVTLSGPLAAILKFTQKCKQTAVSLKLSKKKNFFFFIFLHPIRCLNFWDDKNFWGAKSGPPSPATSVNFGCTAKC